MLIWYDQLLEVLSNLDENELLEIPYLNQEKNTFRRELRLFILEIKAITALSPQKRLEEQSENNQYRILNKCYEALSKCRTLYKLNENCISESQRCYIGVLQKVLETYAEDFKINR